MDNNINSLAFSFINDLKRLENSFTLAGEAIKHLEAKKKWTLEDWLILIGASGYLGFSAYKTYQDGKSLINMLAEPAPVIQQPKKVEGTRIPAKLYLRPTITTAKSRAVKKQIVVKNYTRNPKTN